MTEALQPALVSFLNRHNRQMSFMHGNAPGHRTHTTRGWLAAQNIGLPIFGPRPSKSLAMNPIETFGHNFKEQFL